MMKRSTPLARRAPITRRRRSKDEFARVYGSKERVEWVKSLPCVVCWASPCENAHTISGGKGRKADADTIVPLCFLHHRRYDRDHAPCDKPAVRDYIKEQAARVEAAWQRRSQRTA